MQFFPNVGSVDTVYMGGRSFPLPKNSTPVAGMYKLLRGGCSQGTTTTEWGGLGDAATRSAGSGAAFQIPAGLSFRILAYRVTNCLAAKAFGQMVYADNSIQTNGTSSAPTNPVYETGVAGYSNWILPATIGAQQEGLTDFLVPTGKYPGTESSNPGTGAYILEVIGRFE